MNKIKKYRILFHQLTRLVNNIYYNKSDNGVRVQFFNIPVVVRVDRGSVVPDQRRIENETSGR